MTLRHLVTYQPVLETQNLPGTPLPGQPAQDPHDHLPELPGRRLGPEYAEPVAERHEEGHTVPCRRDNQIYAAPRISSTT